MERSEGTRLNPAMCDVFDMRGARICRRPATGCQYRDVVRDAGGKEVGLRSGAGHWSPVVVTGEIGRVRPSVDTRGAGCVFLT